MKYHESTYLCNLKDYQENRREEKDKLKVGEKLPLPIVDANNFKYVKGSGRRKLMP